MSEQNQQKSKESLADCVSKQKRRRCETMRRFCAIKALYEIDYKGNPDKWRFYSKWMHKWLELVKKFKEDV